MVRKQVNIHKLARQTGFIKRPSVRQKIKAAKKRHERIAKEVADYDDRYSVVNEDGTVSNYIDKASEKHWGIFYKKGYRAVGLFTSKEDAEKKLATLKRPDLFDIREIEWFEEDKEIK